MELCRAEMAAATSSKVGLHMPEAKAIITYSSPLACGFTLQAEPSTAAAGSSQSRPKTPDGKASSSNSSLVQCFGMGKTLDDAAEQEEIPPGVVGLRNLGNCHYSGKGLCMK